MEKNLLLELRRIKELMNHSNGTQTLLKEDGVDKEVNQRASESGYLYSALPILDLVTTDASEMRYEKAILGPGIAQPYPIIFDYPAGLPIMVSKKLGKPILSQFKSGMSAKDFITSNSGIEIKVGDVTAADGSVKQNQEYFENNGVKHCLPDKAFWDLHTRNNYVYKFENPENGKIFAIVLTTLEKCTNSGDNGAEFTGIECSRRCMGANNGIAFDTNGFRDTVTGDVYDPENTEHFDNRSVQDEWWDEWGIYVEILAALVAAVAAPYLAPALLGFLGEAAVLGSRVARIVTWMANTSYLGGSSSVLLVTTEVMIEAGLLSPMIAQYFERGDQINAIATIACTLLGFGIEVPAVKRFINKGFNYTKSLSESVMKKIATIGGMNVLIKLPKEQMEAYARTIFTEAGEKELFQSAVEFMSENEGKAVIDAFGEYILKNGDEIEKGLIKRYGEEPIETAVRETAEFVTGQMSVATGKGIVPVLTRGVLTVGPVVVGIKYLATKLKEMGATEEEADKVEKNLQEVISTSPYALALGKLTKSLGLGPELTEEVINATVDKMLKDDPEIYKKTDDVQKDMIKENFDVIVVEKVNSNDDVFTEKVISQDTNKTEDLKNRDLFSYFASMDIIADIVEKTGNGTVDWQGFKPTKYDEWKFKSGDKEGVVKFKGGDSGTYEIFVDNKIIYPKTP